MLWALLAVTAQAVGGAVWWAWVRRHATVTWTELAGMGTVLGTLLALLVSQLLRATPLGPVAWALPFVAALVVLVLHWFGRVGLAVVRERWRQAWWAWGPAAVIGLLLVMPNLLRTPITDGYISGNRYHGDLVFFEAIAQSVTLFGNTDYLLIAGEPVRYHWLAYGWSGMLGQAVGAEPFFAMTRVLPVLVTLAAAWLAATWATRLSTRRWVPGLASLLVVVAGYVGANQGVLLPFDSPSQSYGTVVLLAFSLAFSDVLAGRIRRGSLIVLAFLGFAVMASKSSQGAVMAAGVGLVALASLLPGSGLSRRRAWAAAVAGGLGAVWGYWAIVAGAPTSDQVLQLTGTAMHASTYQGLDPFAGGLGVAIGTGALVLAMAARWVGLAWLVGDRRTRWQADTIYGIGLAVAGVAAVAILKSPTNAAWFPLAASGQLAVLSAVGLGIAWDRDIAPFVRRPRGLVIGALVAAAVAWVFVFVNYALARITGAPVEWRGVYSAWLISIVAAAVIGHLHLRSSTRKVASIAAVAAIVLMSLSVFARVNGQMLWGAAEPVLGPPLRSFVLRLDPNAQFPDSTASPNDLGLLAPTTAPDVASSAPKTDNSDDASAEPDTTAAVSPPGTPGYAHSMSILEWSPQLNAAAVALREAADPDDIVAEDDTHLQPYAAIITHLRFLVAAQPWSDMFSTPETVERMEQRNTAVAAFLAAPSDQTAQPLRDLGVRWLWLRKSPRVQADALAELTTPFVVNDQVAVLKLR